MLFTCKIHLPHPKTPTVSSNYGIRLEVLSLVLYINSNGKGGSLPVAPLDPESSEPSCLPDAQLTLVKHKQITATVFPLYKDRKQKARGSGWYIAILESSQTSCPDYSLIVVLIYCSQFLLALPYRLMVLFSESLILINKKWFVVAVAYLSKPASCLWKVRGSEIISDFLSSFLFQTGQNSILDHFMGFLCI